MSSIPLVMTKDMLLRGRLALASCILGGTALPVLLFNLLRAKGLDADDPNMRLILFRLMSCNTFFCAFAFSDAVKFRKGLYALPIRTATLVAYQMIPAMLLAGMAVLVLTGAENAAFGHPYPLWGPALFASVIFGCFWATYWITKDSAWQPFVVGITTGSLLCWHFVRFLPTEKWPSGTIPDVSVLEAAGLVVIAIALYFVAVAGITRHRCGETFLPVQFPKWNSRQLDHVDLTVVKFKSPVDAQFWFEWKKKGWIIPMIVAFGIWVGISVWLILSGKPAQLIGGFVFGGVALASSGIAGGIILGLYGFGWSGQVETGENNFGHFVSSRPITNTQIATAILKLIGQTVFIAWGIWATSFLAASVLLLATNNAPVPFLPATVRWWYFPATLLGTWTSTAVCASLILTDHEKLIRRIAIAIVSVIFGWFLLFAFFLEEWLTAEAKLQLFQAEAVIAGVGFVVGTGWMFKLARRHRLIANSTVAVCLSVWIGLVLIIACEKVWHPLEPLANSLFAIGLAALAVVPFATAPLAVCRNRNR